MSDEVENLTGYKTSDFINNSIRSFASIIHSEDIEKVEQCVLRALNERAPYTIEYRILTSTGETRWVFEKGQGVYGGDQLKFLDGVILDITEKKIAEQELTQIKNYLASIINAMPSVLIGIDTDCCITQWNQQAEEETGLPKEKALGKLLCDAYPRLAPLLDEIKTAIREGKKTSWPRHADGVPDEPRFTHITIFPVDSSLDKGFIIRLDDVTEQIHLEEMLIQSEKMLSVGGLAAGMAHEINNPLAGIMQTTDVVTSRLTSPDLAANQRAASRANIDLGSVKTYLEDREILEMLGGIHSSGQRVAEIVNNMLNFAHKKTASRSSHKATDIIEKALELARTDYELKKQYQYDNIQVTQEFTDGLPEIPCEMAKIEQVILNLIRNSAQAMHDAETPNPAINLKTFQDPTKEYVCISISDNGPGMDEAIRKQIFDPFFTTKPEGIGTGLGLSVCYFIVTEHHDGELKVDSSPGAGATFTICLPTSADLSAIAETL